MLSTQFCNNVIMNSVTFVKISKKVQLLEGRGLELYQNSYLIVLVFLCLGILLPVVALFLSKQLRPNHPSEAKLTIYESGNDPFHDSRVQFNVRYYLFALLFLVFDVETIFLYPWAVAYEKLGIFALIEMLIFVFMLLVGLVYAWKKKVLKWN